jgi:hypothetical protein
MGKWLRLIFCLGSVLMLLLGSTAAGAYTITNPTWTTPGFDPKADLGYIHGTYADWTSNHIRMENTVGPNSASIDWSFSLLPVTESWGPGGKTTSFGQRIEVEMEADLATTNADLGNETYILNGFGISSDSSPPLTQAAVTLTVTWGGDWSQARAQVSLKLIQGLFWFLDVIPDSHVNLNSPGNQQTFSGTLPEMSQLYFLRLDLFDGADWLPPGHYASDMWIEMTMDVTEALTPAPVPLPGAWALLGGGLALMAGWRLAPAHKNEDLTLGLAGLRKA